MGQIIVMVLYGMDIALYRKSLFGIHIMEMGHGSLFKVKGYMMIVVSYAGLILFFILEMTNPPAPRTPIRITTMIILHIHEN